MTATTPLRAGDVLSEKLRELSLNQTEAAARLSITRQYLNGIINGKYPLTADLLLKINPLLGTSNEFWAEVERSHASYLASPQGRAEVLRQNLETQALNLDVRGDHTLVNHQIESMIDSGYLNLGIPAEAAKERILPTSYECAVGDAGWVEAAPPQEKRPVSFARGITVSRGMMVTLSTQEVIPALPRVRVHIIGLTQHWASKYCQVFHPGLIEPGMSGAISFAVLNHGSQNFTLKTGEPILRIAFEHLSQEPSAE
jgi:antitoxin HigA-1